jgi:hypothetical protein
MAEASVQPGGDKLLPVFCGTKFSFAAQLVCSKLRRNPQVNAKAEKEK